MAAWGIRSIDAQWSAMINLTQGDGVARRTHVVTAVGFLVAMVDGYDTLMLAFIAPLISKEWALAPQTMGAIFASSYAGAALGATVIGIAADRFGRKTMLIVSLALIGAFTLLCSRSGTASQLMVLRAIAGLGLGGALSATTAITAAHAPPQQRRATVTRMFLGFPVGAIVGGAVTAAVMSSLGWRGVFLGGGICAFLLIPLVILSVAETAGDARKGPRVHSPRPGPEHGPVSDLRISHAAHQLLSGQLDTHRADSQWNGATACGAGSRGSELRWYRRHADPVVCLRSQESAGAGGRLPLC